MKRLFLALLALSVATLAHAQVVPTLPFQLQNGTTADASQVMSNFNTIVTGINTNAAMAGTNTNITSLVGLTTPLSPSVGGTSAFLGGTSGGAANAQTVSATTPASFALTTGYRIIFVAGFTNTAAMTLNVNGTGALPVFRATPTGPLTTQGGEVVAGSAMEVVYDGTRWQLVNPVSPLPPGVVLDYAGPTAPAGFLLPFGQCISRTGFANLFALFGTSYGVCDGSTTFALPDTRGYVLAGLDNMGGTAAGRLTTTTMNGVALGGVGGVQTQTLTVAQLPGHTHNYSGTTANSADHAHTYVYVTPSTYSGIAASGAAGGYWNGGPANTGGITGNSGAHSHTFSGATDAGTGGGAAASMVQPTMFMNKIIKF
jgi:microcystin-dependent protein